MKPLVYVAGPYTHPDPIVNVHRAVAVAEQLDERGCAVFIPHLSMLWHLVRPAGIAMWYRRDRDVLAHCDALVRFQGRSEGADCEEMYAHGIGIPIFRTRTGDRLPEEFFGWLEGRAA